MAFYPAFMTAPTVTVILYVLTVPVVVIVLIVWFIKKINRIDKSLQEILEQMKIIDKDINKNT